MQLMVISDFDGRKRGDAITDPADIEKTLMSAHAHCVVAVASVAPAAEAGQRQPTPPALIEG